MAAAPATVKQGGQGGPSNEAPGAGAGAGVGTGTPMKPAAPPTGVGSSASGSTMANTPRKDGPGPYRPGSANSSGKGQGAGGMTPRSQGQGQGQGYQQNYHSHGHQHQQYHHNQHQHQHQGYNQYNQHHHHQHQHQHQHQHNQYPHAPPFAHRGSSNNTNNNAQGQGQGQPHFATRQSYHAKNSISVGSASTPNPNAHSTPPPPSASASASASTGTPHTAHTTISGNAVQAQMNGTNAQGGVGVAGPGPASMMHTQQQQQQQQQQNGYAGVQGSSSPAHRARNGSLGATGLRRASQSSNAPSIQSVQGGPSSSLARPPSQASAHGHVQTPTAVAPSIPPISASTPGEESGPTLGSLSQPIPNQPPPIPVDRLSVPNASQQYPSTAATADSAAGPSSYGAAPTYQPGQGQYDSPNDPSQMPIQAQTQGHAQSQPRGYGNVNGNGTGYYPSGHPYASGTGIGTGSGQGTSSGPTAGGIGQGLGQQENGYAAPPSHVQGQGHGQGHPQPQAVQGPGQGQGYAPSMGYPMYPDGGDMNGMGMAGPMQGMNGMNVHGMGGMGMQSMQSAPGMPMGGMNGMGMPGMPSMNGMNGMGGMNGMQGMQGMQGMPMGMNMNMHPGMGMNMGMLGGGYDYEYAYGYAYMPPSSHQHQQQPTHMQQYPYAPSYGNHMVPSHNPSIPQTYPHSGPSHAGSTQTTPALSSATPPVPISAIHTHGAVASATPIPGLNSSTSTSTTSMSASTTTSKLNPAAAGFTFTPSSASVSVLASPLVPGSASVGSPAMRGSLSAGAKQVSPPQQQQQQQQQAQQPVFASIRKPSPVSTSAPLPGVDGTPAVVIKAHPANGTDVTSPLRKSVPLQFTQPIIVDGEKFKGRTLPTEKIRDPAARETQQQAQGQAQGIKFGEVDPITVDPSNDGVQVQGKKARRESGVKAARPSVMVQQSPLQQKQELQEETVGTEDISESREPRSSVGEEAAVGPEELAPQADAFAVASWVTKTAGITFGTSSILNVSKSDPSAAKEVDTTIVLVRQPRSDVRVALSSRVASRVPASVATRSESELAPHTETTKLARTFSLKVCGDDADASKKRSSRALLVFGDGVPKSARRIRASRRVEEAEQVGTVFGTMEADVNVKAEETKAKVEPKVEEPIQRTEAEAKTGESADSAESGIEMKPAAVPAPEQEKELPVKVEEESKIVDASTVPTPTVETPRAVESGETAAKESEASAPSSTPAPAPAAPAVPKAKPSTWAALLKPAGAANPSAASASTAEPSKATSPALSSTGLPADDVARSATPAPTTTTATAPAPVSVPATAPSPAPVRKPFNYASAAAASTPPVLTPAEELVKLLSEGVKYVPPVAGPSGTFGPTSVKGKEKAHPAQRFGALGAVANGMQNQGQGSGEGERREIIPRGLINTGNMCFANTILQVLTYCPPFTALLDALALRLKADLAGKTPLLEAMIVFQREFHPTHVDAAPVPSHSNATSVAGSALPSGASTPRGPASANKAGKGGQRDAFVPENVYDAMKGNKRFDTMRRGFQEDAEEYLGFFLDSLHEELLHLLSRTHTRQVNGASPAPGHSSERSIDRPVSPSADMASNGGGGGWLEVGKKQKTHVVRSTVSNDTAISRIFGGTLRSVLHAPGPGSKDSVTIEPYQPLQLDIQSDAVNTISDALRQMSVPETVQTWSAAKKANVDATKTVYLEATPPVLILHLKRFVYDPQRGEVGKKDKAVAYPEGLVIPPEIISPAKRTAQPIRYRLLGVVYHHGSTAGGGHYTVAVQGASGWLHFDDETVSAVPADQVVVSEEEARSGRFMGSVGGRDRCAYLLFYQRVR